MSLEKQKAVKQFSVSESGVVFYVEESSVVDTETNQTIGLPSINRTSVIPGQNLNNCPSEVVAFCNKIWTPEVIAAYRQSINQTQEA